MSTRFAALFLLIAAGLPGLAPAIQSTDSPPQQPPSEGTLPGVNLLPETTAPVQLRLESGPNSGLRYRYQYQIDDAIGPVQGKLNELVVDGDAGLSEALDQYRNSTDGDADRSKARAKVEQALSKQYDQHLNHQEQQIEELSKRLEALRSQLLRRREAKSRMVELKLEMILSQAEGLGWPEGTGTNFGPALQRYFYHQESTPGFNANNMPGPDIEPGSSSPASALETTTRSGGR